MQVFRNRNRHGNPNQVNLVSKVKKSRVGASGEENKTSQLGGWFQFSLQKMEMPFFDGSNPDGWIYKAERYFTLNQFSVDEKLDATVIILDKDALLWYRWEK